MTVWLEALSLQGDVKFDAPLAPLSWFKVGGKADILFRPANYEDLEIFLAACPAEIPITVLGVGSNLIIRDGGIRGVVIRLGKDFANVTVADGIVTAGAAAPDLKVAQVAADAGIAGLEFLVGVPGSIGGAVKMNAGCYGNETQNQLLDVTTVARDGTLRTYKPDFAYRYSSIAADEIVTQARFTGTPDAPEAVRARMDDITRARKESQPLGTKTCGSTFRNPEGYKAWQLIDAAGCRGLRIGGAEMSAQHCNFMINHDGATAHDLEALGEEVRRRVLEKSGVQLEWEIKRIGDAA